MKLKFTYFFVWGLFTALFSHAQITEADFVAKAPFKKVFWIVLENEDSDDALTQPFLRNFAKNGAYFRNFYAATHPSQPNYIAMITGSTQGINTNKNVSLDSKSIVDLLDAKKLTWKSYTDDYPGNCYTGTKYAHYVRKHQPFISINNIRNNPVRCAQIVNSSELVSDVKAGMVPDFAFFVPNLLNDGHDTGIEYADRFLAKLMGPLLQNTEFMRNRIVIVTFDESENLLGENKIYTAIYGSGINPGTVTQKSYGFASLLRTIEAAMDLGSLGSDDAKAPLILDIWR